MRNRLKVRNSGNWPREFCRTVDQQRTIVTPLVFVLLTALAGLVPSQSHGSFACGAIFDGTRFQAADPMNPVEGTPEFMEIRVPQNQTGRALFEARVSQLDFDPANGAPLTIFDLLEISLPGQGELNSGRFRFRSDRTSNDLKGALGLVLRKGHVRKTEAQLNDSQAAVWNVERGLNPEDPQLISALLKAVPHARIKIPTPPRGTERIPGRLHESTADWREFSTRLQTRNVLTRIDGDDLVIVRDPHSGVRYVDPFLDELLGSRGRVDLQHALFLARKHEPDFERQSFEVSPASGQFNSMRDVVHGAQYLNETWVVMAKIVGENNKSLASRLHRDDLSSLTSVIFWPFRDNQTRVRVNYVRGVPASLEAMIRVGRGWLPAIYKRDETTKSWIRLTEIDGEPPVRKCMQCHGSGPIFGPAVKLQSHRRLAAGYFDYERSASPDPLFGQALTYSPVAGNNRNPNTPKRKPFEDLLHVIGDGRLYGSRANAVWDSTMERLIPLPGADYELRSLRGRIQDLGGAGGDGESSGVLSNKFRSELDRLKRYLELGPDAAN